MRQATLVLLLRGNGEKREICLAMKKRGFGAGKWNGAGGKVEPEKDACVEDAAVREAREEIGVECVNLKKAAELDFSFPHNPAFDQRVHVYLCELWRGEPQESEEMAPRWFPAAAVPYAEMWPDDIFWLPRVLEGEKLTGRFAFDEADAVTECELKAAERFAEQEIARAK